MCAFEFALWIHLEPIAIVSGWGQDLNTVKQCNEQGCYIPMAVLKLHHITGTELLLVLVS